MIIGDGASVFDEDGVYINVRGRLEADRNNISVLNRNMSELQQSIHSVVQTMKNGSVRVGSTDYNIKYVWSKCDDQKCVITSDPDAILPDILNVK